MSSMADMLLKCRRSVERPGDFCVGGIRDIFMPTIDLDGVARIAFPILPAQAGRLVAVAKAAPYGRGDETVIDREVRRTWQGDPDKGRLRGRHQGAEGRAPLGPDTGGTRRRHSPRAWCERAGYGRLL